MLRPIPVFPFNVRTNAVGLRSESGRGQVTDHHWPGQDWNDGKKWTAADRVGLALAREGRRTVEDAGPGRHDRRCPAKGARAWSDCELAARHPLLEMPKTA